MAAVDPSIDRTPSPGDGSVVLATWNALTGANNVGTSFELGQHTDLSVHVNGTFNTGAVVMEGSNDGENWLNMTDPNNGNVVFAAAGLKNIITHPRYVRPNMVNNGAATSLAVSLVARRSDPLTR